MNEQRAIDIGVFQVITKALTEESQDLATITNHMCQLLVSFLDIKGSAIFVLSEDKSELLTMASYGLSSDYLAKGPIRPEKSLGCTIRGQSIVIRDISQDSRLQYPQQAEREGVAAIVAVPIMFMGKVVGSFRLYHHKTWDILEEDVDSLMVLGEIMGLALRYTSLYNTITVIHEAITNLDVDMD
jgi:transcriptional regulator with GAF, ATPase, and Fis domain